MTERVQLALDLACRPALGADDFLISDSNRAAVAWLDRWPDWPVRGLAVFGPPGSGKTHLAAVWRAKAGAALFEADQLDRETVLDFGRPDAAVVVENADRGIDERALLQLFNDQFLNGGALLLTGAQPPARWPLALPDLASRLDTLPVVELGPPDDVLLAGILFKQFADQQLQVGDDVIGYLTARMERSFAAARWLVAELNRLSLHHRQRITVPLARRALAHFDTRPDQGLGAGAAGL